ncbi:MAG: hypothetical protein H0W11_00080 [Gemmatimonadetes bacterium]|nr:hypothetical protein [Gemmatimonadota bacterium]
MTLHVDVDQDLYHTSYIYTGLFTLEKQRKISLQLCYPKPGDWRKAEPLEILVHVDVADPQSGSAMPVCFEVHDKSYLFYERALSSSAVYFKRSYFQRDVDRLPPVLAAKVVPFGINYACTDRLSYPAVARGIRQAITRPSGPAVLRGKYTASLARKLIEYVRLPRPSVFEFSPASPKEPVVLFQTRLWKQHELVGESAEVVNQERAALVRALKREFGSRFVGGLLPGPVASRDYPDLLAQAHPCSYLRLTRRSLIGVYSRGLHQSTAWKLGEYFAASMCVVAEPIQNQLVPPLEAERHFLPFSTPEECVAACARILGDPGLQQTMRSAAYRYYTAHVEPAAHLLRCLRQVEEINR